MLATHQMISIGFGVALTPGLLANIMLIIVFLRFGMMRKHENLIYYRLVFNLLVIDTLQLLNMVYLTLTTWLQDYLLPENAQIIPGFFTLLTWYAMCMMLITLAINRYVTVCNVPSYMKIFTPRRTTFIVLVVWPISASISAICHFIIPCCSVSVDYQAYTFNYRNVTGINYVNRYVDNAFWMTATVMIIFCYAQIVRHIRKSATQVASGISANQQKCRAKRNIRIAAQFALISSFFLFTSLFFEFFPYLVPAGSVVPYSAISFCYIGNGSVNSLVYLTMNEEIRRKVVAFLCCRNAPSDGATSQLRELHKATEHGETRMALK
uniref:G-protein coupled receptors family 1 profile domain-containing protein n=1 Tax=Plectus sambesii TaxID=2011161 RepID=A0A914VTA1_9BILA